VASAAAIAPVNELAVAFGAAAEQRVGVDSDVELPEHLRDVDL
jgi:hypothetical protein